MLSRHRLLAALCVLGGITPSAAAADQPAPVPGQVVQRTYTNSAGTRAYDLYIPTSGTAGKPLLIWLHGCGGSDPLGQGHSLDTVAEERGFAVAFPIQPSSANAGQCWNWADPADQHRGTGEPSIIAGITTSLRDELGSDPRRIYVAGYSAGGAMTTVMAAAYPDLYAASGPSAGAPYGGYDLAGTAAYAEMGSFARPVPAFMVQGLSDELSNVLVGRANLSQWLGTDDAADDGVLNASISRTPSSIVPISIPNDIPIPATVEHYTAGACAIADFITTPYDHMIDGGFFYYSYGLGLQRMMMDFLLAHRLGGVRQACGS